jgi:hypothetical protein
MAGYTKLNLKEEVEDQGPNFGYEGKIEARMARVAKLDDEIVELRPFDAVRVHKNTMRGFEAGSDGAEMIAIGAPHTGPGDAETVDGWWDD